MKKDEFSLVVVAVVAILVAALVLLTGCASTAIRMTESADGTKTTLVTARTLFDSKSELAKLRTTATDKTQGVTLSGLGVESSGSNVLGLAESITRAAVEGAIKATKP